jgi:hypothetical protein
MTPSRSILAVMALAAVSSAGCKGSAGFCVYDYDCPDTEMCGSSKRCQPRVVELPPSCTTTADCQDGRVCVTGGTCRYAPGCLNISGPYTAWFGDGGAPLTLVQPLGSCSVTTASTLDGGSNLRIQGTLDPTHTFSGVDGGCSLQVAGDETLLATCSLGSTFHFHLYSTTAGPNRFTPTRCSPGLLPCNGRRCDVVDAGNCLTAATPCPTNVLGIPQCTPTGAP